jgi:hypothetical protein
VWQSGSKNGSPLSFFRMGRDRQCAQIFPLATHGARNDANSNDKVPPRMTTTRVDTALLP